MTWTVWDILITVAGVLHIVGIVRLSVLALRIVKGPVAKTVVRASAVAEKGRLVAESSLDTLQANRAHVESIVRDVQGIAASVRPAAGAADLPITYGSLRKGLATVAMVRQGIGAVRSFGKKASAAPGPAAIKAKPVRVSLPERLGLVPPAAKQILRFLPYLRLVKTVLQQVKRR